MENSDAHQRPTLLPIGIAYLVVLLVATTSWLFRPAIFALTKTFGVTTSELRLFSLAGTLGFIVGSLLVGLLLTRFRIGLVLLAGSLIMLVAYIGQALTASWATVLVFEFLKSLGLALILTLIMLYLLTRYGSHWLIWSAAFTSVAVLPISLSELSWRISCFAAAAPIFVAAVLFMLFRGRWDITEVTAEKTISSLRRTLRIPSIWVTLVVFMVAGILTALSSTLWPILVGNTGREIGFDTITSWTWVLSIMSILIPLFLGILSRYIHMRTLTWVCIGGILIGLIIMTVRPLGNVNFVGLCLVASLILPLYSVLTLSIDQHYPPEYLPNTLAVQRIAFILGSYSIGFVLNGTFSLDLSLIIALAIIIFLAITFGLNQRLHKPKKINKTILPLADS